jgi:ATP-dependent helicase/nuclease subunit B
METSLKKRAISLAEMGEKSLSDENAALWQVICRSLDTIVTVLGDLPCDRDAFLSQLRTVFSSVDIGRIPAYIDQVTVGSADMLRLYGKKHIYLIGVNDGRFPATVSDRSYFTERDRARLQAGGLAIAPEMEIRGARELYIFSRAFAYAAESVTISYSAQDTRFKAVMPADVVAKIVSLTGGAVKPVRVDSLSPRDRLYSPGLTLQDMGSLGGDYTAVRDALLRSGYDREVGILEGDISNTKTELGQDIVGRLAGKPLSLSQSRIDSYVSCPFGYFCRYTVRLGREERAEFDARSIGSFIHGILENFFAALSREGRRSGDLDADERKALTMKAAEKYLAELGEDSLSASVRTRIKIDRLCRAALPVVDGLCDEFRQSAFEPRFFELRLSYDEHSPDPIKIKSEGGDINIFGIIDRVDAYKRGEDVYLRVIDYKTGQKAFSPEDLDEGANLQMFLYLKALVESDKESFRKRCGVGEDGRLIPAGVIYVKTAVGDLKVDLPDDALAEKAVKDAQGREGMILDDPESISAMTLRYTPVYSSSYPDEIRDNKRELLYSEDGWVDLMERVEGAVISAADGIRSGRMTSTPKNEGTKDSPCIYCEFKPICRKK